MTLLETLMARVDDTGPAPDAIMPRMGPRGAVSYSGELRRIEALPRRQWEGDTRLPQIVNVLTEELRISDGDMKLWTIQAAALRDITLQKGAFLPVGVGQGKALISLLAPVVLQSIRPVLLVPAQLREQTLRYVIPRMSKHWRLHPNLKVVGYSELSLAKNARMLEELNPDLIVLDECFVAGTLVMTPNGALPIEAVLPGDMVIGGDGQIVSVVNNIIHEATELVALGIDEVSVLCTGNHPFLTTNGWIMANNLEVGHEVVCLVQREASSQDPRFEVLWKELFSEMAYVSTGNSKESLFDGGCSQGVNDVERKVCRRRIGAHEGILTSSLCRRQSNVQCICARESGDNSQNNWTQAFDTGRKWSSFARAAAVISGAFGMDSRACSVVRTEDGGVSHPLQNRHCRSNNENCGGSGWRFTLSAEATISGYKKTRDVRGFRMARVTSKKQGCPEQFGKGSRVYNLEVTGSHTYVLAETGAIVHNCHSAKNFKAGRTRRLVRYFREHPETMCVAMSGTISNRSIRDFAHIIRWCLKNQTPVPEKWNELAEWADALDEKVPDEQRVAPGALQRFCQPGENVRQGFRRRLTETPGVVATQENLLGTSLRVVPFVGIEVPREVERLAQHMRSTWATPNGDIITEAVELWRHMRELALGFYYKWDPPAPKDWLEARKAWKKYVREVLKHNRRQLDTELQVWNECEYDEQLPEDHPWRLWSAIKGTFRPKSVSEWVDDFAVKACCRWLEECSPGICWVEHRDFGIALASASGKPYFGAGDDRILECDQPAIIASQTAHGEGKNLQRYCHNLITSPMASGKAFEQLLGRSHRAGQEADEVTCEVFVHMPELFNAFGQALSDARYLEDTFGNRQKLNYCDLGDFGVLRP